MIWINAWHRILRSSLPSYGRTVGRGGAGMLLFEGTVTFEPDQSAVIWATTPRGERFKVRVTRAYAEKVWRIRYSEAEVTTQIWLRIDDVRRAAARAHADGSSELVL